MELANIEKLVKKYLNAETTLQEEQTLKEYFTSKNVASHLQEYTMLFGYFNKSKDETYNKTIQLKPEKSNAKNWKWLQVAASIVLMISMYVGYGKYQQYQEDKHLAQLQVEKQEKQFAQVTKALKLLSTNLNKGNQAVASLYTCLLYTSPSPRD